MNLPKPRCRAQAQRNCRFAQGTRNVLQSSRGVADNRQETVEEKCCDCGAHADSEKRQRNKQREQCQRRNGLHNAGKTKNNMAGRAAATRPNAKRNSN